MIARSRTIVLAANSLWYITNFRVGLVRALRDGGYRPIVVAPSDPKNDPRLAELGIEFVPIEVDRKGLNPLAEIFLLARLRRLLRRLRPFAYVGFTIKPNIYGALAASTFGIPVIANVSGLGTAFIRPGALQRIVTGLYRVAFRRAVVFFENADDRRLFVDRKIVRAEQTRLVPGSGIDLDRFAVADLPSGSEIFLLIARLIGDKGVREFVEAARSLRPQMPDSRFQLLGGIDEGNRTSIQRSELDAWVEEGVIEYFGETDDVRPFIAKASAIVLPSYREGLPRSLLEGAAMGRPLIATDVPGCRDVVDEGVNGFLCEPHDPASLAHAMERLGRLPEQQRASMGAASRRKVQEQFDEALVIRAYLDALASL
ncbi:MAG: glycosyltransferase family 4 protein [Myxococcales bacterium]